MTLLSISLTLFIMMTLPLALAIGLRRRFAAPWWLFCVGMLTFVAAQALHLPLNKLLTDWGVLPAGPDGGPLWLWALLLGFTAALCETLARVVGYALLFRRGQAQQWSDGVMLGLGHGGIESFGLVATLTAASVSALWGLRGTDLSTLAIPAGQLATVQQQLAALDSAPWLTLLAGYERLLALTLHVALSLLVWQGFKRRSPLPVLLALLAHMLFDSAAVYLAQQVSSTWLLEGILTLLALPALGWIVWSGRGRAPAPPHHAAPLASDLALFGAALRKELRQQWRTRSLVVVVAIFLFFGLGSPLLARFTPELLGSLPGAEQFAELIPKPTTADALSQYIKNITQFGFIIAVLLGMGAVAGEKDRGTTAMILSKPLPRWGFVLSKFAAQGLVYGLGFALAALGAYYYTLVLFDPPLVLGAFVWGNVLLLTWLLVFAAVTLLASTLARAVGQAAGLALAGAVLLLLAGSLPVVGGFAPAGLVAWASQLGLGAAVTPVGGALVANLALILVLLITAVAAFEVQEL